MKRKVKKTKTATKLKKGKTAAKLKKVKKSAKATKARKTTKVKRATKTKKVTAIPKGYHSITPLLTVNNAAEAIEFYKKAFAAKEVMRFEAPNGKISYANLKIGDSNVMLNDEFSERNMRGPQSYGGSPVSIHLYIAGVDSVVSKAVAAGAKIIRPVSDKFYGDRSATLEDPYGHHWHVSTHIEDVSKSELKKRSTAEDMLLEKVASINK